MNRRSEYERDAVDREIGLRLKNAFAWVQPPQSCRNGVIRGAEAISRPSYRPKPSLFTFLVNLFEPTYERSTFWAELTWNRPMYTYLTEAGMIRVSF